jgi:hypothetical protein
MNEIERELRSAIQRQLGNVAPSSSLLRARTIRAVRRRRVLRVGAASSIVLALGVTAFMLSSVMLKGQNTSTEQVSDGASNRGTLAHEAGGLDTLPPGTEQLTPKIELASGVKGGTPWSLVASKARVTKGPHTGEQLFCSGLGFGSEQQGGLCEAQIVGHLGQRIHVYPVAHWRQDMTALAGFLSNDVADVRLRLEDGTLITPDTQLAPPSLDPAHSFFVAFLDPAQDVNVIALDTAGDELQTVVFEALPRLSVVKTGSGSGVVTGVETCESCVQAQEPIVDCGDDCWAEFEREGGSITLKARPDEGSTFVSWEGGCEGTTSVCVLESQSDVEVNARFEPAD